MSTDGLERAISVSNAAAAHVVAATLGGEAPGAETNKLVAAAQKRQKRASGIPEGSADDMALEALYRRPARLSRSRSFGTAATAQREQRERREAEDRPEPGGTKESPSYDLEVQGSPISDLEMQRRMIQRRAEELDAHRQLQQRRADQRERVYEGRLGMSTLHVSRSQLYRNFDTSAADAPGNGEGGGGGGGGGGGVPRSASPLVRRAARNAGQEAFSVIFGRGPDADGGSTRQLTRSRSTVMKSRGSYLATRATFRALVLRTAKRPSAAYCRRRWLDAGLQATPRQVACPLPSSARCAQEASWAARAVNPSCHLARNWKLRYARRRWRSALATTVSA